MSDTDAKTSSESETEKESPVSSDRENMGSSGELAELNIGADLELDEDDLAMLFALGLC